MDWIWLIFVLFSVVAGLLEKLAKLKNEGTRTREPAPPAPASPRPPGEGRFFLDELEKRINPDRPWPEERPGPGERPWLGERRGPGERPQPEVRVPAGRRPLATMSFEDEYLMPAFWEEVTTTGQKAEWADEAGKAWETERDEPGTLRDKSSRVEQSWEEPLPGGEWTQPETFLPALVLAQVLQRPDFRVLPWQRRI